MSANLPFSAKMDTEDPRFPNLKLVHEEPTIIQGEWPVRIYTSDFVEDKVRYHLGFKADWLPEIVWTLAETEPYLGEKHWCELDGFYLFWEAVSSEKGASVPFAELQKRLVWAIRQVNAVRSFLNKTIDK